MPDFEFRPVVLRDVSYCWTIYRDAVQPLALELNDWDEAAHRKKIEEALADADASILVENHEAAGWLHVEETRFEIHLAHLYIEPAARNHGLGSKFMRWMNERARRKQKNFTIEVLKNNNRARAMAERLGFRPIDSRGNVIKLHLQAAA